ncbi:MAG: glycosyl transferase group 1 [Verrucomicrobiales bacterium]|nr:glycosyl transferase group 1 [Verrucomicrobiales bacterium]
MARFHADTGDIVEVASLDSPSDPWVREFPIRVHALGPVNTGYGYTSNFTTWLRNHYQDFDAVIVDGLWQYSSFGVWRVLRGSMVPYYVFPHGMLDPWFKRTYPLKHMKKWLYWPWAEYRVLRDAKQVFFTCEEERRLARESFWLYRCHETVVGFGTTMPSGDPLHYRLEFLTAFPALQGQEFWLFLARLHEKKGIDLLLQAFARISPQRPSLRLVIAGPDQGCLKSKLEQLAARLKITDRIIWTGMLSGDLKWGAFYNAEVFILPSHQENFGIAVAEALACRVPVLISNKVNIWREIEQEGAGFVGNDDLEGLFNICLRWLDLQDSEKHSMRRNALVCFERHFEMKRLVERFRACLKN